MWQTFLPYQFEHPPHVVGQGHKIPFQFDLGTPSQVELPEPHGLLDNPKDRFDGLLPEPVALFAPFLFVAANASALSTMHPRRVVNRKQLRFRCSMASRMKCTMCRSGTQSLKSGGKSIGVNLSTFTSRVLMSPVYDTTHNTTILPFPNSVRKNV